MLGYHWIKSSQQYRQYENMEPKKIRYQGTNSQGKKQYSDLTNTNNENSNSNKKERKGMACGRSAIFQPISDDNPILVSQIDDRVSSTTTGSIAPEIAEAQHPVDTNWRQAIVKFWASAAQKSLKGAGALFAPSKGRSCLNCQHSTVLHEGCGDDFEAQSYRNIECGIAVNKPLFDLLDEMELEGDLSTPDFTKIANPENDAQEVLARYCPHYECILLECGNCHRKTDLPLHLHPAKFFVSDGWSSIPVCSEVCAQELSLKVQKEMEQIRGTEDAIQEYDTDGEPHPDYFAISDFAYDAKRERDCR